MTMLAINIPNIASTTSTRAWETSADPPIAAPPMVRATASIIRTPAIAAINPAANTPSSVRENSDSYQRYLHTRAIWAQTSTPLL